MKAISILSRLNWRRRAGWPLIALSCLVAVLALAGCASSSTTSDGSGGGANSNAYKLASLDQGSDASVIQTARYQNKLDQLNAYCRQNEDQLARMAYAAGSKLTDDGLPTTSLSFMQSVLYTLEGVTPRGNENCAVGFALTMSALRADAVAG